MWGYVLLSVLLWLYSAMIIFIALTYSVNFAVLLIRYRKGFNHVYDKELLHEARAFAARICDFLGRMWNGYEVDGLCKIPDKGGAMLVMYHGATHVDCLLLQAKCSLLKKRGIRIISDKFMNYAPGVRSLSEVINNGSFSREQTVNFLKSGHICLVCPGGLRECQFGDKNYKLMWGNRTGFCKVALEANVPLIPVFGKNSREMFRSPYFARKLLRPLYEKLRIPLVWTYGPFPVKLRLYVGNPIYPTSGMSPEELRDKVKLALEDLILQHQRLPGSIFHALMERFERKKAKVH